MADPIDEATARNRWAVIQAVRLGGVAMVLIGILVVRNVIPQPAWTGYVILGVGLVDLFVAPQLLARKWRSPPDAGIE